ncbi:hypothetical protein F5884DRAFT_864066 [Xylogone sp. PMI_703]|nr:hypothetical protein F5884DRAFT_864066 [Xylogone sp. PMI_703]
MAFLLLRIIFPYSSSKRTVIWIRNIFPAFCNVIFDFTSTLGPFDGYYSAHNIFNFGFSYFRVRSDFTYGSEDFKTCKCSWKMVIKDEIALISLSDVTFITWLILHI